MGWKEFFKLNLSQIILIIVLNILFILGALGWHGIWNNNFVFLTPLWAKMIWLYSFLPSSYVFISLTDLGDTWYIGTGTWIKTVFINIIYTYFVVIILFGLIRFIKLKLNK